MREGGLAPRAGELIVQKTTRGPLNSRRLDHTLRVLGVDTFGFVVSANEILPIL